MPKSNVHSKKAVLQDHITHFPACNSQSTCLEADQGMRRVQWKAAWAGVHSSTCSNDRWCLSVIRNTVLSLFQNLSSIGLTVCTWSWWRMPENLVLVRGFQGFLCLPCASNGCLSSSVLLALCLREFTLFSHLIKKAALKQRLFWRDWMLGWEPSLTPVLGS